MLHQKLLLAGILLTGLGLLIPHQVLSQNVSRATGGGEISADKFTTGEFTTLSGPTITETSSGQLEDGGTIILMIPDEYEFEWDVDNFEDDELAPSVQTSPVGSQNTHLEIAFNAGDSDGSQLHFNVVEESRSTGRGRGQGPGIAEFQNLRVRPTSGDLPNSGRIVNGGTTAPNSDVNYGDLNMVEGDPHSIAVETEPDGTGERLGPRELTAGNTLTGYSIVRDMNGNFITNKALEDEEDWILIIEDGGVVSDDLSHAGDLRSATLQGRLVGQARIQANLEEVQDTIPSEIITVIPSDTDQMIVDTQPEDSATAGEVFDPQPEIRLEDEFGNFNDRDDETSVTVSLAEGDEARFQGGETATASSGIAAFTDLAHEKAETISLQFEASGLSSVTSDEVTIQAASKSALTFEDQPSNTIQGQTISPPVTVWLRDEFNNPVEESGVTLTVEEESGNFLEEDGTETTNEEGIAVFNELGIDSEASTGDEQLQASDQDGLLDGDISDGFRILSEDDHSGFIIRKSDSTAIDEVTAGEEFDIKIWPVDGSYNFFDEYGGTAEISSTSEMALGEGITPEFTEGEPLQTTVSVITSGEHTLTAQDSEEGTIQGATDDFTVLPAGPDPATSLIAAADDAIRADGFSQTPVTVTLRDEFGNSMEDGGEEVSIATTKGTLEADEVSADSLQAIDNNNGTYEAELTSSTEAEEAELSGALIIDGTSEPIDDTATVTFQSGNLDSFVVEEDDNGGAALSGKKAGELFPLRLAAVDQFGNTVSEFDDTVKLTTDGEFESGGGETATFTEGILEGHEVSIRTSGATTITATRTSGTESGTSNEFTVEPAEVSLDESGVKALPERMANEPENESVITVELRDTFGNTVTHTGEEDVTMTATVDGTNDDPDADLSEITFDEQDHLYEAVLTATETIEDVRVEAFYDGDPITETALVEIVLPNVWRLDRTVGAVDENDWFEPDNWSLERIPSSEDVIIIPSEPADGEFPDVRDHVTISSLTLETSATLNLQSGQSFVITNNMDLGETASFVLETEASLEVEGNVGIDYGDQENGGNGGAILAEGDAVDGSIGGDIELTTLALASEDSRLTLNGDLSQKVDIEGDKLVWDLRIRNEVSMLSDIEVNGNLNIAGDDELILQEDRDIVLDLVGNITGNGRLDLKNNTLEISGEIDLDDLLFSDATVVFNGTERQRIAGLEFFNNLEIDNPAGVRVTAENDISVSGELTLTDGNLIFPSGFNVIADDKVYEDGYLSFEREITEHRGWRMMSAPVDATYKDWFEGLTTQGIPNSAYPNDDVYQPNLMYYDETYYDEDEDGEPVRTTDNQRWRAPDDMEHSIQTGTGYFIYVFGNVEGDGDYNDTLPDTLTVSGREHEGSNAEFDFNVTYTDEADTAEAKIGWNLIGNPFGATLDWDDDGNWTKENVDNVVYVWDQSANEGNGAYLTWNGDTGSLDDGLISPFQGFWVKADGEEPALDVAEDAKTTGGEFRQRSASTSSNKTLALELEAAGQTATTHFSFSENAESGKGPKDGYFLQPMTETYLKFYSVLNENIPMAIRHLPERSPRPYQIPLGVGGYVDGEPINGNYVIRKGQASNIPDHWEVSLYDREADKELALEEQEEQYIFDVNSFYGQQEHIKATGPGEVSPQGGPELLHSATSQQLAGDSSEGDYRFELWITPDEPKDSDLADQIKLRQNYPNPFNNVTTIEYALPEETQIELQVYNILGQRVTTLVSDTQEAGFHSLQWDASDLASGVYLYRLTTEEETIVKKLTLMK